MGGAEGVALVKAEPDVDVDASIERDIDDDGGYPEADESVDEVESWILVENSEEPNPVVVESDVGCDAVATELLYVLSGALDEELNDAEELLGSLTLGVVAVELWLAVPPTDWLVVANPEDEVPG